MSVMAKTTFVNASSNLPIHPPVAGEFGGLREAPGRPLQSGLGIVRDAEPGD